MERIRVAFRVISLTALAACASPRADRDAGEPVTVEDLEALPAAVTPENARQVVRQCLQRHRRAASGVHRRYGYRFSDAGFVQFRYEPQTGSGEPARVERVYVDFAAVASAGSETFVDVHAFRETVRVALRGRFRSWSGRVTPFRPSPEPGAEPETRARDTLELDFPASDAAAAKRLVEALNLLRGAAVEGRHSRAARAYILSPFLTRSERRVVQETSVI
jgi:hypothetical protein